MRGERSETDWSSNKEASLSTSKVVEIAVVSFVLSYGLHYIGYFIRQRYFALTACGFFSACWEHVLMYLGHVVFLVIFALFLLAVKKERSYMLAFLPRRNKKCLLWLLLGICTGFLLMGICILSAKIHGDITVQLCNNNNYVIFFFGFLAVLIQASTEEIESRCFLFGRMKGEGVPAEIAIVVSSFFFSYIHLANPGFGLIPFISIMVVGIQYALAYHYFGNVWFCFGAHAMWNYTQDFLFGLPDSGKPAVVSVLQTTVNGNSFFYDADFGIEGSLMAICVNLAACFVLYFCRKIPCKE